jgi:hypothetical protein
LENAYFMPWGDVKYIPFWKEILCQN